MSIAVGAGVQILLTITSDVEESSSSQLFSVSSRSLDLL